MLSRNWLLWLATLAVSSWTAFAFEVKLDETDGQRCSGMYSRNTWGGPIDPVIIVKFLDSTEPNEAADLIASLVIFEWKDVMLIGIPDPDRPEQRIELCQEGFDKEGWCTREQIGQYLLAPNATRKSNSEIQTTAVNLASSGVQQYKIVNTGYYCVFTDAFTADKYEAVVEFRNAYGELPASQIPKLPFYGGLTILYALVAVLWAFLYYQHRGDILAVQNYITAIIAFLVVEMLMTWGYYQHLNQNGANIASRVLMVIVGILNAARSSFSFFLLLIVCMGYGVVKPTLGRVMVYVRWLAIAHFVFGVIYSITSLLVSPESAGVFVLLIVLPLAGTLTIFYVWTLNSLNATLKNLHDRKQHAKEAMYRKLWWAILTSVIVIFGFFSFNSVSFASVTDDDYVPFHWKTRWFILDGWLNIVYFADVTWIAYLWRPTANNRRFAMSDELAQDDDGTFEIGDIGNPDESDDDNDEEARIGIGIGGGGGDGGGGSGAGRPKVLHTPAQSSEGSVFTAGGAHQISSRSGISQQQQQQHRMLPRDSLDGETLFAVAEDGDKDDSSESEDDDDDDDDGDDGDNGDGDDDDEESGSDDGKHRLVPKKR